MCRSRQCLNKKPVANSGANNSAFITRGGAHDEQFAVEMLVKYTQRFINDQSNSQFIGKSEQCCATKVHNATFIGCGSTLVFEMHIASGLAAPTTQNFQNHEKCLCLESTLVSENMSEMPVNFK